MAQESFRYRAFISYRHVERDRIWARWLIEKLEAFRTPSVLVRRGIPARIDQVFRDDDEIPASNDLSHQIEDALRVSQYLVVVCSPRTPHSKWVRREIQMFQQLGRGDHILALLTEGEPEESFPPELLRIARERNLADGAKSVEWDDVEPIAADVRDHPEESRRVTERRALLRIAASLLGCRLNDLVQREHQRRMRRQRLWGAVAALLLLCMGAATYEYWDYNRIITRYYADIGTHWGIPYGIGELSARIAKHRGVSYAISSQRGRVTDVRRVNGSGGLVSLSGNGIDAQAWDSGVAEWRISSPGNRASDVEAFNDRGRRLRIDHYVWQPDGSAEVSFSGTRGGAEALSSESGSLSTFAKVSSKSSIAAHRLIFDKNGNIIKRFFHTIWGLPAKDSTGSFGRAYRIDSEGHIIAMRDVDENGNDLVDRTGLVEVQLSYTIQGDLSSYRWRGTRGTFIPNAHGYAALRLDYDDRGNAIAEDYFGTDGKPILREDTGYARTTKKYDDRGNDIEEDYFGTDGKPSLRNDMGFARRTVKYDDRGNDIEEDYFGTDGKPILRKNMGFACLTIKYDDRANDIEEDYFGTDGKPILRKDMGFARRTVKYDDRGNAIEEDYFGTDGKRILRKDMGFARRTVKYDDRGNAIEEDYFGTDGKPILSKGERYSRVTRAYDDGGNIIEIRWFGKAATPVLNSDEVAREVNRYDERGNITEVNYFGTEGEPVLDKERGVARLTIKYNGRGNQIELDAFGIHGEPILDKDGISRLLLAYDYGGNVVKKSYFGSDGKPILIMGGIAGGSMNYDNRGNETEQRYFGIDGRPVVRPDFGSAGVAYKYNSRGDQTEMDFFDLNGRPIVSKLAGAARETKKYDLRDNVVEIAFFGPDGKPFLSTRFGIARLTARYDDRGNVIELRCFGVDSKPMLCQNTDFSVSKTRYDQRGNPIETEEYDVSGRLIRKW